MISRKKQLIADLINIEGVSRDEILSMLQIPENLEMGDLSLPCFKFSKLLRKSPTVVAEELAKEIKTIKEDAFSAVEAVNGYLNFKFNRLNTAKEVLSKIIKEGSDYGNSKEGKDKTVCIDYSSINIAKLFHIGHLSTTVIGSALYKVYKKLGYNAIGINHLGDWGTQFGKLIVAFKLWGSHEELEKQGVEFLTKIYVKFHTEAEKDASLDEQARYYFKKLEEGDTEALSLFQMFKDITLKDVKSVYDKLNVTFDSYNGEAFFNDKMDTVLDELESQNLISVSEGAKIVDLNEYKMPPCLLVKADGASLYATRDLAAAFYRKKEYDFYKCLYVVAYQQNLHFKQIFQVLELMGKPWAKDLYHIPFGMVSLENEAMSTRKGNVVLLKDVLNRSVEKSLFIMQSKGIKLKNQLKTAEQVGIGAVIFFALSNNRIKDIVFSYDKVLAFEGETGPYVQYTYARASSILRNINTDIKEYLEGGLSSVELIGLDNFESAALIGLLERFPQILSDVLDKYEPSLLTRYIIDVAKAFNKFYLEHNILKAENNVKKGRAALVYSVSVVIKEGLRLLGIACPEEM